MENKSGAYFVLLKEKKKDGAPRVSMGDEVAAIMMAVWLRLIRCGETLFIGLIENACWPRRK